jgi:pantothenate kinase type III
MTTTQTTQTTPVTLADSGLDRPVALIGARAWAGLLALLIAVGTALTWGIFGSVPQQLTLPGLVLAGPHPVAELLVTDQADLNQLVSGRPVILVVGTKIYSGQLGSLTTTALTASQVVQRLGEPVPGLPASDQTPIWLAEVRVDGQVSADWPVQATVKLPALHPYQIVFGGIS